MGGFNGTWKGMSRLVPSDESPAHLALVLPLPLLLSAHERAPLAVLAQRRVVVRSDELRLNAVLVALLPRPLQIDGHGQLVMSSIKTEDPSAASAPRKRVAAGPRRPHLEKSWQQCHP